jgi:hypothetical protein
MKESFLGFPPGVRLFMLADVSLPDLCIVIRAAERLVKKIVHLIYPNWRDGWWEFWDFPSVFLWQFLIQDMPPQTRAEGEIRHC